MLTDSVTTDRVDYLQRCGPRPEIPTGPCTVGGPGSRRLIRVRGIGRPEKHRQPLITKAELWRPATAELITGLYGYRIPLAFYVVGSSDGIGVHVGTWSARAASGEGQNLRVAIIESVLRGLYPMVDLHASHADTWTWPQGGLALGVPAPAGIDEGDGAAPIDRVIRSMAGTDWALLVLAYPAAEGAIAEVRDSVLNEIRAVQAAASNEGAPSPLTEQYVALLTTALIAAGDAMATGAWRTAVYLLGDRTSYPRLASAWRSVMSGVKSLPEPARVFDLPQVTELAHQWALPDQDGAPGPGRYRRPFEYQTVLSTAQLAACIHLPELEVPGFTVRLAPRFDVVAPTVANDGPNLVIGQVLQHGRATVGTYQVPLRSLTRHVFVAGMTGSGKTNTILALLHEASTHRVPFLVIEPAKTEYRILLDHPDIGRHLRIFTPGNEQTSPLRLNPFEIPTGSTVAGHLDLLRAVFGSSFGMWGPLPHVLERCLHEVYTDRGWDVRTNRNRRMRDSSLLWETFPTLADLAAKVKEVAPRLGYEQKVTDDIRAALLTRLDSLRTGGKGAMLDTSRSLPMEELLTYPTVVELEGVGNDDDKAFLIGLILIRLAEYRRATGPSDGLTHLLVVEEAHRLLTNVTSNSSENQANPRAQAVETFTNLLSEVRAYGQGVLIADQVPIRLAPDVIKNTNLKLAHRVVAADDRVVLGGSMAMTDTQNRYLSMLDVGQAAAFSEGDDAPILIAVPRIKNGHKSPDDHRVNQAMTLWRANSGLDVLYHPRPFCSQTCTGTPQACETARSLMEDDFVGRTVARIALSTSRDVDALDRMWPDLLQVLRARRPIQADESQLLRAFAGHAADWFAARRGAQCEWSYQATNDLAAALRHALLEKVDGGQGASQHRKDFQAQMSELHRRDYPPYPACERVCDQDPPLCLYRTAAAELVASRRFHEPWRQAEATDAQNPGQRRNDGWRVSRTAAYELVELPDESMLPPIRNSVAAAARRASLCFAQQMVADDQGKVPRTGRWVIDRILDAANGSCAGPSVPTNQVTDHPPLSPAQQQDSRDG